MMMPSDEEIAKAFEGCGIYRLKPQKEDILYFEDEGLDTLAGFTRDLGIRAVFVEKVHLSYEELHIPDELCLDLPLDIIGGVQLDSHVFNKDLRTIDLSGPVEVRISVIHEGRRLGVVFTDAELDSLRKVTPESRVRAFAEARREKARERKIVTVKEEDPLHEKFAQILILDHMYRDIKDRDEKVNYVMKIARRPGNDGLRGSVMKDDGKGFSLEKIRKVIDIVERRTDRNRTDTKQMVFGKD